MTNAKKKSSGWRPGDKRRTPKQWQARQKAKRTAQARRECDLLRLWRSCPAARCRRVRGCSGDPEKCMEQQKILVRKSQPRAAATASKPAAPVMSAAEAAAAIAASIAAEMQRGPPSGEGLVEIIRDGRVHYEPRRKA
jgi:hypothetical protein